MQQQQGIWYSVAFTSWVLNEAETRYAQTDVGLDMKFAEYVLRKCDALETDHKPLVTILRRA